MTEYDIYQSLTHQENIILNERIKQLEDEVKKWRERAYEIRKFAPLKLDW